jgi:polyisoprenoid-binding protein YceI
MRRIATGLAALLLLALAAPVREFTVDDAWGRDTVQFRTTAPLEDIVGTTNEVTGVLKADPKNLTGPGASARIEVVLKTIKTGIEMRDGHVANALGAERNPVAVFTLERIKSASASSLEPNVPVDVTAEGYLELKGVRKKIDVTARLTYVPRGSPFNQMRPGSFVKLIADFDVRLADFGVERKGQVLPLQVGETAHVTVTALASDASPEEAKAYRETAVKYMGKARK